MHLSKIFFAVVSVTSVTAASSSSSTFSSSAQYMMDPAALWTIRSLQRACTPTSDSCTYTFGVDTNTEGVAVADCEYMVRSQGKTPASQSPGGPSQCGNYTITSSWSDQFGADPKDAFTVLSVVNKDANQIVYPGYTDLQLQNGEVVSPDQSYTPQALPTSNESVGEEKTG